MTHEGPVRCTGPFALCLRRGPSPPSLLCGLRLDDAILFRGPLRGRSNRRLHPLAFRTPLDVAPAHSQKAIVAADLQVRGTQGRASARPAHCPCPRRARPRRPSSAVSGSTTLEISAPSVRISYGPRLRPGRRSHDFLTGLASHAIRKSCSKYELLPLRFPAFMIGSLASRPQRKGGGDGAPQNRRRAISTSALSARAPSRSPSHCA